MCCKADTVLHILGNAEYFSMFVDHDYLFLFNDTDFRISINPFTANPGYWQMCIELSSLIWRQKYTGHANVPSLLPKRKIFLIRGLQCIPENDLLMTMNHKE